MMLNELVDDGVAPVNTPPLGLRRKRALPYILAAAFSLVVVAFVVVFVLAASYQPLVSGGSGAIGFPGLPSAIGARLLAGDPSIFVRYIPFQKGEFAISESVQNNGPNAVSIEAVSLSAPGTSHPYPLMEAGRVLYMPEYWTYHQRMWTSGRPLKDLSLAPNQGIVIGFPLRMAGSCYVKGSGTPDPPTAVGTSFFYVKEKYLLFTHWVAIPMSTLVMPEPESPGSAPGSLVCPK